MKKILCILWLCCLSISSISVYAQCNTGYSQAQLNWDHLNYYYSSATNTAPYGYSSGSYISDAMAQSQKFALGTTFLTIQSIPAVINGENGTHTGNISGYEGDDVQFTPTANGQTITITFAQEVQNVRFALYDIDRSARMDIDAYNASNIAQRVNITTQTTTLLTTTNNNNTGTYVSIGNTSLGTSDNRGTAIVSVAGPVNRIVLTATTTGTNETFWLSDISACVQGSFPTNYHQITTSRPFTNQPQYFIVTPDNNSAYMVDVATGRAKILFTDAANTYINSFAYDAQNRILYYISESTNADAANKQLKKYDFNTETIGIVSTNIVADFGIPTFDQGVQSGGACFYNGALYLGIEGGRFSNTSTRESIIWKVEFNPDFTFKNTYQVWATPAYNTSTGNTAHDWGDFMIKDGMLYDFNTARQGSGTFTYPSSAFHHYNMMTGTMTNFANPNANLPFVGQAGMDWSGNLYSIRNAVEKYNQDGTMANAIPITVIDGPAWVGNAGDASEPFRPKADFGDAPANYDSDPLAPAVHEMDANLKLGNGFDREWEKKVSALSDADAGDDGLPFARILNLSGGNYQTDLDVFNNTGADAIVCAWIDYNSNGIFESSEGIETTVSHSAATQRISLYWPSISANLPTNSYTVLRIRITSATNGMTRNNPTGYFANGEVEDHRIIVNATTLAVKSIAFNVVKIKEEVKLQWNNAEDNLVQQYIIERSRDGINWNLFASHASTGSKAYMVFDRQPLQGTSYYRLLVVEKTGRTYYSGVMIMQFNAFEIGMQIIANPVSHNASLAIQTDKSGKGIISIFDVNGRLMIAERCTLQKGFNKQTIPVSQIPAGQYFVQLEQNGYVTSKRLVIVR